MRSTLAWYSAQKRVGSDADPADRLAQAVGLGMEADLEERRADGQEGRAAGMVAEIGLAVVGAGKRFDHHHGAEADAGEDHFVGVRVADGGGDDAGETVDDGVEAGDLAAGEVEGEGPVGEREVEIEIAAEDAHQEGEDDDGDDRRGDRRLRQAEGGGEEAGKDRQDHEADEQHEGVDDEEAVAQIGLEIAADGAVEGECEERAVAAEDAGEPWAVDIGRHQLVPAQRRVLAVGRPVRALGRHLPGDRALVGSGLGLGARSQSRPIAGRSVAARSAGGARATRSKPARSRSHGRCGACRPGARASRSFSSAPVVPAENYPMEGIDASISRGRQAANPDMTAEVAGMRQNRRV